ncbi:hypothetical protein NMY22_g8853 [Coprinellus aureogranulatus]|nr:hypothetical protein NMY22_g8853 [Coprinellus aureogranulatus]
MYAPLPPPLRASRANIPRVNIYDIKPGCDNAAFRLMHSLVVDASSFTQFSSRMSCDELKLMDGFLVMEIGWECHAIVWNFGENWYALGPKRHLRYREKVVLSPHTVVELDECGGVFSWTATAETVRIYPVRAGEVIDFTEALAHAANAELPDIDSFPFPTEVVNNQGSNTHLGIPPSSWRSLSGNAFAFDVVVDNHGLIQDRAERLRTPVTGYRFKLTIMPNVDDPQFDLLVRFELPPISFRYHVMQQLPGILGYRFGTGSAVVPNGYEGGEYNPDLTPSGLCIYGFARCPVAKGRGCTDKCPVQARLTRLLDRDMYRLALCVASGRMFCAGPRGSTPEMSVSDFLPPWDEHEVERKRVSGVRGSGKGSHEEAFVPNAVGISVVEWERGLNGCPEGKEERWNGTLLTLTLVLELVPLSVLSRPLSLLTPLFSSGIGPSSITGPTLPFLARPALFAAATARKRFPVLCRFLLCGRPLPPLTNPALLPVGSPLPLTTDSRLPDAVTVLASAFDVPECADVAAVEADDDPADEDDVREDDTVDIDEDEVDGTTRLINGLGRFSWSFRSYSAGGALLGLGITTGTTGTLVLLVIGPTGGFSAFPSTAPADKGPDDGPAVE